MILYLYTTLNVKALVILILSTNSINFLLSPRSYQGCRKTHFRLETKNCQSQRSVKCRSRVPGQGASLKNMSRTIIAMQGFRVAAFNTAEKHTLVLD